MEAHPAGQECRDYRLDEFTASGEFPFFIQYGWHPADLPLHGHADFFELAFVLGGSAIHRVEGQSRAIARGDVLVLSGTMRHGYSDVRELSLCNIMFRPGEMTGVSGILADLPAWHLAEGHMRLAPDALAEGSRLLRGMMKEHRRKDAGWTWAVTGLLMELLVLTGRKGLAAASPQGSGPAGLERGIAWMESHSHLPLTLEDIAREAGLSPRHFARLFRQSHGTSPHRHLLTLRLAQACRLLEEGTESCTDVALACGFSDGGHFSRMFRERMGTPPSDWRHRLRD